MRFHDYLESMYVATNLELQKEYSPFNKAYTMAVQNFINAQRRIYIWASYPILIFNYALIKLGLKAQPKTPKELYQAFQTPKATDDAKPDESKPPESSQDGQVLENPVI